MELKELLEKTKQVLDEEQRYPTASYKDTGPYVPGLPGILASLTGPNFLHSLRSRRPREILEDPQRFRFESVNYQLLCALYSQASERDKESFTEGVLLRVTSPPACRQRAMWAHYPVWNHLVSELPLVAEFVIRQGRAKRLFQVLGEVTPCPGHVLLLLQIEEMVALNYTVLTEEEYRGLQFAVTDFWRSAATQLTLSKNRNVKELTWPGIGAVYVGSMCSEIIEMACGIKVQCEKARYLYLKGQLLEGLNLEINQDKDRVKNYLQSFGFSKTLIECLEKADQLYQGPADAFDMKSSMGHLRSFLENLHNEAGPSLAVRYGAPFTPGWGPSLAYLRQNGFLSTAEEQYAVSLYRLMSDEGVHPLITEKEYARLARNVVIEYALLFLRKLEKLNLNRA